MDANDLKSPFSNSVLPPFCGQSQFATWAGVSDDTVRGWIENKTLPTVRIGRGRYIDVLGYVEARTSGKTIFSRGDFNDD